MEKTLTLWDRVQSKKPVNFPIHPEPLELGRIVISAAAQAVLSAGDVADAISRHTYGDWGDLEIVDRDANRRGLYQGDRVFSSYTSAAGVQFHVITEWHRVYTTIILPEDY